MNEATVILWGVECVVEFEWEPQTPRTLDDPGVPELFEICSIRPVEAGVDILDIAFDFEDRVVANIERQIRLQAEDNKAERMINE